MFSLKPISIESWTKIVLSVTFIVALSACSQSRRMIDEGETRVIPQSEFGPGESWRDQDDGPTHYASTKENFRARVKKSGTKSGNKSVVSR